MKKGILVITAIWAGLVMLFSTGCASGGFKYTRQYAGFVNKQNIIIRIILYLLTGIVFAVTMLLDLVIFNTMDFWEGRVSQGSYRFEDSDKNYFVEHKINSDGLKQSTIVATNKSSHEVQKIVLQETITHEILVLVDDKKIASVSDISLLPKITRYDAKGNSAGSELIPLADVLVAAR